MSVQPDILITSSIYTNNGTDPHRCCKKKHVRFDLNTLIGIGAELYAQQFDELHEVDLGVDLDKLSEINLDSDQTVLPLECHLVDSTILVNLYDRPVEMLTLVNEHHNLFQSIQNGLGNSANWIDFYQVLFSARDIISDQIWLSNLSIIFQDYRMERLLNRFNHLVGYVNDELPESTTRSVPRIISLSSLDINRFRYNLLTTHSPNFINILHCDLFRSIKKHIGSRYNAFIQTFNAPVSYIDTSVWCDSIELCLKSRPDLLGYLIAVIMEDLND